MTVNDDLSHAGDIAARPLSALLEYVNFNKGNIISA
jgi:hypothetical protein